MGKKKRSNFCVEFDDSYVLRGQQSAITRAVTAARNSNPALMNAGSAVVYSNGYGTWWHTSRDPVEHVTVRFEPVGSKKQNRVHVYKNGTARVHH